MKPERRTLQEQVGVSLNASVLRTDGRSPDVETPLMQVAALGAAALAVHHGADRGGLSLVRVVADPAHIPNPQDVLTARLASNLWHIRYARQHELVLRTVGLFAEWIAYRGRFAALADAAVLLPKFAERVLHEWLSDRCQRCGGSGRLELTRDGVPVRGRGRMQRNALFTTCAGKMGCGGTGRPTPSHTQRRLALAIDHQRYDGERWDRNFAAGLTWLTKLIDRRLNRPLTDQLERSTKRD